MTAISGRSNPHTAQRRIPCGILRGILLISGQDDPVGDGGKGVQEISRRMKKSGMENVTVKLFPGARHDLLHEEKNGADTSRKFIAEWIKP